MLKDYLFKNYVPGVIRFSMNDLALSLILQQLLLSIISAFQLHGNFRDYSHA